MRLEVKKLSKATILKIYFIGIGVSAMTFTTLCSIAALFGAETVNWNGDQITGSAALIYGPLIGAMITVFATLLCTGLSIFGLWVYSFFKPLSLEFTELSQESNLQGSKNED